MGFFYIHYVYVLYSKNAGRFYIGETKDISRRLAQNNRKNIPGTSKGRPMGTRVATKKLAGTGD